MHTGADVKHTAYYADHGDMRFEYARVRIEEFWHLILPTQCPVR